MVLAEAGRAADAIASIGRDLHKTLVEDSPVLETTGDIATAGTGGEAATALDRLAAAVAAVADEAEAQPGEAWTRRGERPDGPVTAGDLLRAAVHAGVHHLRLAQQV